MVLLVHLDTLNALQLLDAALYLHRLGGLVAESLDKGLGILNLLLLILKGTQLLLAALLAQHQKLIILHLIVVDAPA